MAHNAPRVAPEAIRTANPKLADVLNDIAAQES